MKTPSSKIIPMHFLSLSWYSDRDSVGIPECLERRILRGQIVKHIEKQCFIFYKESGRQYYKWSPSLQTQHLAEKIRQKRKTLRNAAEKFKAKWPVAFKETMEEVMSLLCHKCNVIGPQIGSKDPGMKPGGQDELGMERYSRQDCRDIIWTLTTFDLRILLEQQSTSNWHK